MADALLYIFAGIGIVCTAWGAGACIRDMFDNVPDHLPPPRDDSRDTRRQWDRIQGRGP